MSGYKYGPNKEYFNKDQIIVEHGVSKTIRPTHKPMTKEAKEELDQYFIDRRKEMIDYITSKPAVDFVKIFPFHIDMDENQNFTWETDKLQLDEFFELSQKYTLVKKISKEYE